LRRTGVFMPVGKEDLAFIEAFRSGVDTLPAGETLIPEFRASTKLYTLYSGWAFRFKTLSDGRRQILNFLLPGDLIGLQDEFVDQSTHGVEALTDISFCEFPREKLVDENLLTAGRRNAMERVAMLLIHLHQRAQRIGLVEDGWAEFPLVQQHMADALGLSLVHTNKTLRRLQKLGIHELQGGKLRLVNPKALQRIAEWVDRPNRRVPLL
jgi:CRP-like cAMP-binding protein